MIIIRDLFYSSKASERAKHANKRGRRWFWEAVIPKVLNVPLEFLTTSVQTIQ